MMYLLTEQEHIFITQCLECRMTNAMLDTALEMLKAMKPVPPVGWWDTIDGANLTYSVGELMGGPTDGLKPLYAKEQ